MPKHTTLLNAKITTSAVQALTAGALTINLPIEIVDNPHCFTAVEFYNDAAGLPGDVVLPGAGTTTFTLKTPVLPNQFQPFTSNVVTHVASNEQVSYASNPTEVRAAMAGITVATHARLRVMCNNA